MTSRCFADVVLGEKITQEVVDDLIFPDCFAKSLLNGDLDKPFLRKASVLNGRSAIVFSEDDEVVLSERFNHSLIGKSFSRMSLATIRNFFQKQGFRGNWKIGLLDRRHFLIQFDFKEDYIRCFSQRSYMIENCLMKLLKWTSDFVPGIEPPIHPVWMRLPGLRVQYYNRHVLYSIAVTLGKPLKMDGPTKNLFNNLILDVNAPTFGHLL